MCSQFLLVPDVCMLTLCVHTPMNTAHLLCCTTLSPRASTFSDAGRQRCGGGSVSRSLQLDPLRVLLPLGPRHGEPSSTTQHIRHPPSSHCPHEVSSALYPQSRALSTTRIQTHRDWWRETGFSSIEDVGRSVAHPRRRDRAHVWIRARLSVCVCVRESVCVCVVYTSAHHTTPS